MSDTITCPSCQRTLRVPESLLGQLVKCPTCQQTFTATLGANGAAEAPPPANEAPPPPRDRREDEPPRPPRRDEDYDDRPRREDDYDDRPRRRRRRYQQEHRGPLIMTLGILSFFVGGPILGLIAWIMGSNDLKEMRAGRMDPEGESQTNTGRICGMISTLIGGIALLGVLGCCAIGSITSLMGGH
jgi:predicted Zn finger-like uncharacterized protein